MRKLLFTFLAIIFINACTSEGGGLNLGGDGNGGGGGGYSGSYGSVSYGGQTYKTVVIGTQTWMAENLNYNANGSVCYDGNSANCVKYGRLYSWATAMNLPSTCNENTCSSQVQSKHQGICPSDWHIPSNEDWDKLFRYVDGNTGTSTPYESLKAGRYLKAISGWYNCDPSGSSNSYLCEDTYGFVALSGGNRNSSGNFGDVGYSGLWWSAYESTARSVYSRIMEYSREGVNIYDTGKSSSFSIRCVKN